MSNIIDRIESSMDEKTIIDLINKYYESIDNFLGFNSYEYFKKQIPLNDEQLSEDYMEIFVELFKDYVSKYKNNYEQTYENNDIKILKKIDINEIECFEDLKLNSEYNKMSRKYIYFQDTLDNNKSRYIHINTIFPNEEIECRFYMCPEARNIGKIIEKIVKKHEKMNLPYHLRVNTNIEDNDRIILFSDIENAETHLKIINEVRNENPELFTNMGYNKLWGKIENQNDVYFGVEPSTLKSNCESYSSLRGIVLDQSLNALYRNNNYDHFEYITPQIIDYFKQIYKINALSCNICPENFALNKQEKPEIILGTDKKRKLPIQFDYIDINNNTISISTPIYYKDENKRLIITSDEFEKLYENTPEAEEVKDKIYDKLQEKHRKSKTVRKLKKINFLKFKNQKFSINKKNDNIDYIDNGIIDYNLYKLFPKFVCKLICKRKSNQKKIEIGNSIPSEIIELANLDYQLSSIDSEEEKNIKHMINEKFDLKNKQKVIIKE